jgi:hypothetical protein
VISRRCGHGAAVSSGFTWGKTQPTASNVCSHFPLSFILPREEGGKRKLDGRARVNSQEREIGSHHDI